MRFGLGYRVGGVLSFSFCVFGEGMVGVYIRFVILFFLLELVVLM